MEANKDNANPTILNQSDLPSRRSDSGVKKRDDGGTGLFDSLVPAYTYLTDPFDQPASSSDTDDDSVEEIDEQEIYGIYTNIRSRQHISWETPLTVIRSHIHNFGPRASLISRFSGRCEPPRYPHPTSKLAAITYQHRSRRDYAHYYTLLARYSDRAWRAGAT